MVGRNINTLRSDTEYPNFFRSGCLFLTKMIEGSRPYLERSDQNFYETPKFTWFSLRHIYVRVRYTCKYPSKLPWFGSNSVKLGVLYRIKIQKSTELQAISQRFIFYFYFSRRRTTKPYICKKTFTRMIFQLIFSQSQNSLLIIYGNVRLLVYTTKFKSTAGESRFHDFAKRKDA